MVLFGVNSPRPGARTAAGLLSSLILAGTLGASAQARHVSPERAGARSGLPDRQERRHRRTAWHGPVPSGRLEPVLPRRPRQETAERAILRHLAEQSADRLLRHEQLQRGRSPGRQRRAVGRVRPSRWTAGSRGRATCILASSRRIRRRPRRSRRLSGTRRLPTRLSGLRRASASSASLRSTAMAPARCCWAAGTNARLRAASRTRGRIRSKSQKVPDRPRTPVGLSTNQR